MHPAAFRVQELAFRTQYAELKERVRSTGRLLPGTPGTLVKRNGSGRSYWYRVYQEAAGRQVEDLVCRDTDEAAYDEARRDLEFAKWVRAQVRSLRQLEFQVADKRVARVLVALYNAGLFRAGLCVVGTLGYMAWLNELGARAVTARTQDIDLAAERHLTLATPRSFLEVVEDTKMGFRPVPGLSPGAPSSSVKIAGAEGLRIDVLTPGDETGRPVAIPALQWHAQTVAHYDYLLDDLREAAVLAAGHCVPVRLPAVERFIWHKLYSSAARRAFPEKALKDLRQAITLAAVVGEQDEDALSDASAGLPPAMKQVLVSHLPVIRTASDGHRSVLLNLERALGNP